MRIVLIDNDDSFTRNLEHLLTVCTGAETQVVPYARLRTVNLAHYDWAVISPGPGHPADYPGYGPLLESGRPVLGICLGMQIMNDHFGGETRELAGCVHGKTDRILFDEKAFTVARYHSLYLNAVSPEFEVIARNGAGIPMAMRHRSRPLIGYQFHPESFLTEKPQEFIAYATRTFQSA